MTMLGQILRIKQQREARAELALAGERTALAAATRRREQADAALQRYQQWCVQREREMYDGLCSRVVQARDLQWVREDMAALREQQQRRRELLDKAAAQRDAAEQSLQQARARHLETVRARQKFIELVEDETDALQRLLERGEEIEAEDNPVAARDPDDGNDDERP